MSGNIRLSTVVGAVNLFLPPWAAGLAFAAAAAVLGCGDAACPAVPPDPHAARASAPRAPSTASARARGTEIITWSLRVEPGQGRAPRQPAPGGCGRTAGTGRGARAG